MENDLKSIGKRIKEIRGKRSQVEFGSMLNVTGPTVSNYESGETDAGAKTLIKIAKIGETSTDWLLTGKDPQVKYTTSTIGNHTTNESGHPDLSIIKQVIEAVTEHLQNNDLDMPPAKIAELVEVLYEEISESNDKQINKGTVARMIKLASS